MIQAYIAALTLIVLIAMSLRANRRFSDSPRLPMQWSPSGSVNWTAPRGWALAFSPMLAALTLAGATLATTMLTARPGQANAVIPAMIALALCLIAAHALHLWLIDRTLKTNRG